MKITALMLLAMSLAAPLRAAEPATLGQQAFMISCAGCHGSDARGDEGPNLHHLSLSDDKIAATIKNGIKGEMPSFERKYDDAQIAGLIAYLRSLP